jgi:Replication-relaxation
MAFKLNQNDCKILETIADCRILTPTQLAMLLKRGKQAMWRRIRALQSEGLITASRCDLGQSRGRPEQRLGLTEHAFHILVEKNILSNDVAYEAVAADTIHCPGHQLLLNWFRISLLQLELLLPRLHVKFLSANSPLTPEHPNGKPIISSCAPLANDNDIWFIPDAAFAICDEIKNMTCMFFLEVDCGTETIASPKRAMTDVRQKIINYQSYYVSDRFNRYKQIWSGEFIGYRLLFLTNTSSRLAALSKLAKEMLPNDFIWLTDQSKLLSEGLHSKIWARGGKQDAAPHSILGSIPYPGLIPVAG